jgi:hypothetical protein
MYESNREERYWVDISWHPIVLALRQEAIASFWSGRRLSLREASEFFYARLREEETKLPSSELISLRRPCMRTLERWIRSAENFEAAMARRGGRSRPGDS